jgi:hypothetical protein
VDRVFLFQTHNGGQNQVHLLIIETFNKDKQIQFKLVQLLQVELLVLILLNKLIVYLRYFLSVLSNQTSYWLKINCKLTRLKCSLNLNQLVWVSLKSQVQNDIQNFKHLTARLLLGVLKIVDVQYPHFPLSEFVDEFLIGLSKAL